MALSGEGSGVAELAGIPCLRLILQDAAGRTRLTSELLNRLMLLTDCARDVSFVTIEGLPGSFCEGLDLELLTPQQERITAPSFDQVITQFGELLRVIARMPRPVIALVDGPALGGGFGLAAAADLILASPQASFALPEALMGLIPAIIFPYVALRIGVSRARLLALGGLSLSVTKALEAGLVDEITDDLESTLSRYAARFSRMDRRALSAIKDLTATHFGVLPGYNADAASRFFELCQSEETQARLQRFLSGETPWREEDAL